MKQSEAELLEAYAQYQINRGVKNIWVEVPTPLGTADMVYEKDDLWFVVEGKASNPTFLLLSQCVRWKDMCSGVRAVIPHQPISDALLLADKTFSRYGVALITISDGLPAIRNHVPLGYSGEIKGYVRDSQRYGGQFAKAGTAGGRRGTKANEEYLAVEEYVAQNPDCTLAEAGKVAGVKAMKLLRLIKDGHVRVTSELVGGKTYLKPLDKE